MTKQNLIANIEEAFSTGTFEDYIAAIRALEAVATQEEVRAVVKRVITEKVKF